MTTQQIRIMQETSDRRIRSLRENGEHLRDTSAWRDALHERQMLDFFARGCVK